MLNQFGLTYKEVEKSFGKKIYKFKNQNFGDNLDNILSNTVNKFSKIVKEFKPNLIVYHGDRIETLACAIVGSTNHILTAHLEGGEISGSIDDSIRHAVTKLSHTHFVGNEKAKKRVTKMGEQKKNISIVGSADSDTILSKKLPSLNYVKKRYDIGFDKYAIILWHPVTSELKKLQNQTEDLINFINNYNLNFVVIYSNNDPGTKIIINNYKKKLVKKKTKLLKSMRFESFLSLLKNAKFIIGNSSSGIYEAPLLGVPCINVGNRQHKRVKSTSIKNIQINELNEQKIKSFLQSFKKSNKIIYGKGNTAKKILNILKNKNFWKISNQKYFIEN